MTTDQPVISLRPGGGGIGLRAPRLFPPRSPPPLEPETSSGRTAGPRPALPPRAGPFDRAEAVLAFIISAYSFLHLGDSRFEPLEQVRYTRDQLLEMRKIVDIAKEILKLQQDISAVLLGDEHEDQSWLRNDSNVQSQSHNRYTETDSRDWRSRSQTSPTGPTPALVKAEVPWSVRRGNLSEKEKVLKAVKGIPNKLTPEKFDLLKGQLIEAGITTADILKDVITLIFEKAVFEPTFCQMYAQLCFELNESLPSFPPEEPGDREITFKRVLLNNCQEAFEGAGNLRAEELLGSDSNSCPAEENVEAICQFFNTIGKQLDENPKSRRFNDVNFNRMKDPTTNTQLAPRLRFMARDVLDLRSNNWVPRREEIKAKKISEIHTEAEMKPGL
ncbi:eukaryotic translation initiation factor isoform 4G-2-like [Panicum miliaceum]|uniref:Eukaryotic translation initiation factor isoform 4G-2-like n=1 Tax=Panicum miliaceum TaxID=4540 RepID=A0A3L6QCM1_PANMI|nr:eukaryotic translation initiation factor isoform 4G-2-like [Panicum miliaceum]